MHDLQPIITNGLKETRWLAPVSRRTQGILERKPITLKYKPPVNGKQTAELVSQGGFKLRTEDGEEHSLAVDFRTAFSELFAAEDNKAFPMRLTYDRFSLSIKLDDKPLPGDADIQRAFGE